MSHVTSSTQPANTQPANTQPANTQPANTQPTRQHPAPSTRLASTQQTSTQQSAAQTLIRLALLPILLLNALLASLVAPLVAEAQITPDRTLGAETSQVGSGTVQGSAATLIEGGAQRGAGLFHSFQDFNVGAGDRVYFANPAEVRAIFSRVTGGNASRIDGLLGVNGGADLYILNPQGLIFGPGAQLDISGSFLGSTASSWDFAEGFSFSATQPVPVPLLSVSLAPGLQIGALPQTGRISTQGDLRTGQNLTLQAAQLDLRGQLQAGDRLTLQASDSLTARDSVAQTFLAKSGGALSLQGNQLVDLFVLTNPSSALQSGGDLTLRSANPVIGDARYSSGGSVRIETLTGQPNDLLSPNDPIILATGDFSANNYSGASLHIIAGGSITLGQVTITGTDPSTAISPSNTPTLANITLSDGTALVINGSARPTLDLRAGVNWNSLGGLTSNTVRGIDPPTSAFSPATSARIETGNIRIAAPNGQVYLSTNYQPNLTLDNGNIQTGSINTSSTIGLGGDIVLDSRDNIALNGARINSASSLNGSSAGDIKLLARKTISLSDTILAAPGVPGSTSGGGAITLKSGEIALRNNSQISNGALGSGPAGAITLQATREILLVGSSISSRLSSEAEEPGSGSSEPSITLTAPNIALTEKSRISTDNADSSGGGTPIALTSELLTLRDSQITATGSGSGSASNLSIQSRNLELAQGGLIQTSSQSGLGGDVTIALGQRLVLGGGSRIETVVGPQGSGGSGGTVSITAQGIRASGNSDIVTRALTGSGGQILLQGLPASQSGQAAQPIQLENIQRLSRRDLQTLLGSSDPLTIDPKNLLTNDIVAIRTLEPDSTLVPSDSLAIAQALYDSSRARIAALAAQLVPLCPPLAEAEDDRPASNPPVSNPPVSNPPASNLATQPATPMDQSQTSTAYQRACQRLLQANHPKPDRLKPEWALQEANGFVIDDKGRVVLTDSPSPTVR